jgi:hypothetical protein
VSSVFIPRRWRVSVQVDDRILQVDWPVRVRVGEELAFAVPADRCVNLAVKPSFTWETKYVPLDHRSPEANAGCGSTAYRAGCTTPNGAVRVGPNGAATYNKNNGELHTTQTNSTNRSNDVAAGTNVQGSRGNSATKAFQQGCAWVNGKKVCN